MVEENKEDKIQTEKNLIKYKINELKAEVYELIKQQEILSFQNNQVQELKLRKVQEINTLENLHGFK